MIAIFEPLLSVKGWAIGAGTFTLDDASALRHQYTTISIEFINIISSQGSLIRRLESLVRLKMEEGESGLNQKELQEKPVSCFRFFRKLDIHPEIVFRWTTASDSRA